MAQPGDADSLRRELGAGRKDGLELKELADNPGACRIRSDLRQVIRQIRLVNAPDKRRVDDVVDQVSFVSTRRKDQQILFEKQGPVGVGNQAIHIAFSAERIWHSTGASISINGK